jgi:hypothetical protein
VILRPFFSYFGSKWRTVPLYPRPTWNTIVEPFAGSASYSLHYPDRGVLLYDSDPVIAGLWAWLIDVPEDDIMALPIDIPTTVDALDVCQEAKWLIGFWCNKGTTRPSHTPSKWMRSGVDPTQYWGANIRERVASQLQHIRHWRVRCDTYLNAYSGLFGTWFIDPPYNNAAGRRYVESAVDYESVAAFAKARLGQVIVCEQEGADWMPFRPLAAAQTTRGRSKEVVWP